MARTIYREWFVHFRYPGHESVPLVDSPIGPVPEGWEVGTLTDVAEYIGRGISPKYDEDSQSVVINQRCIRDHKINLSVARRHKSKVSNPKYVQFGDVLVNSTGVGTLGRVAQVREQLKDCTVDSHVTIIRPASSIDVDYFGAALLELEPYFEAQGAGATGQTELRRDRVGEAQLLIPDLRAQSQFGAVSQSIGAEVIVLLQLNQKLAETRDLLLPRLISGQISLTQSELNAAG